MPMRAGEQPNAIVMADRDNWQLEKLNWTTDNFTPLREGLEKTIAYYRDLLKTSKVEEAA
jgi:hypothetical protein